jgi:hypothetical protein
MRKEQVPKWSNTVLYSMVLQDASSGSIRGAIKRHSRNAKKGVGVRAIRDKIIDRYFFNSKNHVCRRNILHNVCSCLCIRVVVEESHVAWLNEHLVSFANELSHVGRGQRSAAFYYANTHKRCEKCIARHTVGEVLAEAQS